MNEQAQLISIATECISDLSKELPPDKKRQLWRRLIATGQKGLKGVCDVSDKTLNQILDNAGYER